jgi:hypothetical protein
MKRSLFVSLFWLIALVAAAQSAVGEPGSYAVAQPPAGKVVESRTELNFRDNALSAITVLKADSDGTLRGTMMNEFGISALSFTVSADRRHLKLLNVMPKLNKWYIKKVLRADLRHLFSARNSQLGQTVKHRTLTRDSLGTLTLTNDKRHITYIFQPFTTKNDEPAQ